MGPQTRPVLEQTQQYHLYGDFQWPVGLSCLPGANDQALRGTEAPAEEERGAKARRRERRTCPRGEGLGEMEKCTNMASFIFEFLCSIVTMTLIFILRPHKPKAFQMITCLLLHR
ncbi:hypothetical protein PT974_06855 [Cladobotryum mycophilum]|uniref:Uncharacterized protein n=1 Tax=Cladobotryum mycophilum TaxID=491253 RepID=A0ABR0SMY8_9HYPO